MNAVGRRTEPPLAVVNAAAACGIFLASRLRSGGEVALVLVLLAVGGAALGAAGRSRARMRTLRGSAVFVVLLAVWFGYAAVRLRVHDAAALAAAASAPRTIVGRVVRESRTGIELRTGTGERVRVRLSDDQLFVRDLVRCARTARERELVASLSSEERLWPREAGQLVYEVVAVRRHGIARAAVGVEGAASGLAYACAGRLLAVGAVGRARAAGVPSCPSEGRLLRTAYSLARAIRTAVCRAANESLAEPAAGLAKAVVSGEYAFLGDSLSEVFRRCGLAHVIAISGQHVGVVLGSLLLLCRTLRVSRTLGLVCALVTSAIFVPLSGFAASAARAWLMAAALGGAFLLGRNARARDAAHLSAFAFLAHNPWSLFDLSFALSLGSVMALIYWHPPLEEAARGIGLPPATGRALAATIAVNAALAPLLASAFGEVPFFGILASVVAAPATAPLTVSAFLLPCARGAFGQCVAFACERSADVVVGAARAFGSLPCASVRVSPSVASVVAAATILVPIAVGRRLARRELSTTGARTEPLPRLFMVAVALAGGAAALAALAPGAVGGRGAVVLAVGEGNAIAVRDGNRGVLIDAGPPAASVTARLRRHGVAHLDAVFITHPHLDHVGGLPRILSDPSDAPRLVAVRGGGILVRFIEVVARRKGIRFVRVEAGVCRVVAGNVTLEAWATDARGTSERNEDCAIVRAVITGIRGRPPARLLVLADAPPGLQRTCPFSREPADVLVVSHHGSARDFVPEVVAAVAPRLAAISAGPNRHGHPAPMVVAALERAVPRVACTREVGDIVVRFDS